MQTGFRTTAALSVLFLFESCGVNEVHAEEPLSAKVDAMVAKYNRPDSPGCAIGIIRDGELIYGKGFGSANLDHEVPNTPRTIFESVR